MVQAQALQHGVELPRTTRDVDMVIELGTSSVASVARELGEIGYLPKPSIDHRAPFHRLARRSRTGKDDIVDVMAPDRGEPPRQGGRSVLQVPASRSAFDRSETLHFAIREGCVGIRVPNVPAALALKGGAYGADTRERTRHLQDGLVLLACLDDIRPLDTISNSMGKHLNTLIKGLMANPDPWMDVPPLVADRADDRLREYRPGWRRP